MQSSVHSINLQEPSKKPCSALTQAGQVAIEYLDQTGQAQKNQSFMIFQHMAEQAVKRGAQLPHIEFEAAALKEIVSPTVSKDPSGWISQLWKELEKHQERWKQGMHETARAMGLNCVPVLKKVSGSPAKYQLLAEPINSSRADSVPATIPSGGLRYTSASVAAPGAMIHATLRQGVVPHVQPLVIVMVIMLALLVGLLFLWGWWMLALALRTNAPITTAQLSYLCIWGGGALAIYRSFGFLGDLGDFGIVMAPDFMVPFKEHNVTLEVRRDRQHKNVSFAFVRYTAICPKCNGTVVLYDGQREFIGRIVGRCRLSPREHVFSFDQKLLTGTSLRGADHDEPVPIRP